MKFRRWCRQGARDVDRSRRMERSTEPKASSDGTRLNRVQMARALREGAGAEDGRGAEERTASVERNWSMDSGLRRVGASVTLGVLLASTLTGGRITALRADFLQHAAAWLHRPLRCPRCRQSPLH